MPIENEDDLRGMTAVGRVVGDVLRTLREIVRPGMATSELDRACDRMLADAGARPAPMLLYKFPGSLCVSVNEEVVHGIPGRRILRPGDLVKIDVTAELNGYIADAAITVPLAPVTPQRRRLCETAERALVKVLSTIRAGMPLNAIGRIVETEVTRAGFTVLMGLAGHGVGKAIHEEPSNVCNHYDPELTEPLTDGMVIAIEPLISTGSAVVEHGPDGWTIRTEDGSVSAHFEHTVLIRKDGVVVLTE